MKKTIKTVFSGVATALITPFKNGEIDYSSLRGLIEFQISEGADALLINGTTGESATLSDREKRELIAFCVREIGKRVPLIAGTGSNDTAHARDLSQYASDAGADAVLVVTPYYNKASSEGLFRHYTEIADNIDVPMIIYNVPSRTGLNIPLDVYEKLANHKNIVGVKEAGSSVGDFAKLSQKCGTRLDLYSGNDDLVLPTLSLGGKGVISVLSNLLPRRMHDMCSLFFEGKVKEATELQLDLIPLIDAIFSEVNPIPIKALLSRAHLCEEEYRLPLCPLDSIKRKKLFEIADLY